MNTKLLKKFRNEAKNRIKVEIKYDEYYKCYYPIIYEYTFFGNKMQKLYDPFVTKYQNISIKELKEISYKLLKDYRRSYIINKVGDIKANNLTNTLFWF